MVKPKIDFDMIKEYFSHFDVHDNGDTYFGITLEDIKTAYLIDKCSTGYLCGFIENGKILSLAAVEFSSQVNWEICGVSTHPNHMGKGLSKAVCSFIAKYILEHDHVAVCETNSSNFPMQAVMKKIGMKQYYPV